MPYTFEDLDRLGRRPNRAMVQGEKDPSRPPTFGQEALKWLARSTPGTTERKLALEGGDRAHGAADRRKPRVSFDELDMRGRRPNRAMAQRLEDFAQREPGLVEGMAREWARSPANLEVREREAEEQTARMAAARKDPRNAGAGAAVLRSLVTRGLDAAMLPVTVPARAIEALGYPNEAARLSANETWAEAESLARDEGTAATRERHRVTAEAHPTAAELGGSFGEVVGSPLLARFARGPRSTAAVAAASSVPATRERAYLTEGRDATNEELSVAASIAALAAGAQGVAARKGVRAKTGAPIKYESPEARQSVRDTLGRELDSESLERLVGVAPEIGRMKPGDVPQDVTHEVFRTHNGFGVQTEIGGRAGVTLMREFERTPDGKLIVNHSYMSVPSRKWSEGVGTDLLKRQVEEYDRLGVDRIELMAANRGRSQWPFLGFELKNPDDFYNDVLRGRDGGFIGYLKDHEVPLSELQGISNINDLARWKHGSASGREYLTSSRAPMFFEMTADLRGPSGDYLRRQLGIQPKGGSAR